MSTANKQMCLRLHPASRIRSSVKEALGRITEQVKSIYSCDLLPKDCAIINQNKHRCMNAMHTYTHSNTQRKKLTPECHSMVLVSSSSDVFRELLLDYIELTSIWLFVPAVGSVTSPGDDTKQNHGSDIRSYNSSGFELEKVRERILLHVSGWVILYDCRLSAKTN